MIKIFIKFANITLILFVLMMIQTSISHSHQHFLKRLIDCGFNPTNIIDIGANRGDWSRNTGKLFPNANFIMVEGNKNHCPTLDDVPNAKYQITLVSDVEKNLTFYQTNFGDNLDTGSSVYKENTNVPMIEIMMAATTIDIVMKNNNFLNATFLKLDIQGSELAALKGATTTLQNIEVILTEVRHPLSQMSTTT